MPRSIFEASERLGGKAGAAKHGPDFDEHGYHIFPAWYYNARQLATELGILDHFADCEDFLQLEPAAFPHFTNYKNITSWRYAWRNLKAGVMPFFEAFLFYYAALDLMSQPYSYRAQLDQVTVTGFLRSRFYRTDRVAQSHQREPLFMNNVGGWACRPEASMKVPNLYLAGDYCRSHIDLVSMEGAISTGLLAAEAVRKDAWLADPVEILVPPTYPDWLVRFAKVALIPVAALAYPGARYYERVSVKY